MPGPVQAGGHFPPTAPAAPAGQFPPAAPQSYPSPAQPAPGQYPGPGQQQHQQAPFQQPGGQFPPAQGGFNPAPSPAMDWEALADQSARADKRKRRLRLAGIGLAVVLVGGGGVGGYLVLSGKKDHTQAGKVTTTGSPKPSDSAAAPATPAPQITTTSGALADSGGAYPATIGPHAWVTEEKDRSGHGLELQGVDGSFAQTAGPVVDTSHSFTVSALVRNDAPVGSRSALSQGTTAGFSFELGREGYNGANKWTFKVNTAPGDGNSQEALSQQDATTGRWTLLTGVYDQSTQKISLYVDGTLASSTPVTGVLNVAEPMSIGKAVYKGQPVDFWSGAIARAQVWNQALPADKVSELSSAKGTVAATPATASWIMD
ncbi:LamG domain-containing protein [Kitasatospora sp. LaBMicrA B282]|uniref:LamG domain-containing protein n=1 Tax=Kitasatospora sp. LaBMicrA B282 TaxID=3420949 RepID=UPI003D10EAF5